MLVDIDGVAENIRETQGFGLQEMLEGYLGVSGPCKYHLSCET